MNLPNTERLKFDPVKHAYTLDGKLLSGVTSVIDGTSSKANLVNWAANMAVDYIQAAVGGSPLEKDPPQTVISVYYDNWLNILLEARTAHTRRKESAGQKGTDTHALVEAYINARITNETNLYLPPEVQPFHDWAMTAGVEFLAAEQRLYSETHGFAGTCDFIASIDDKLTIGDLKTFPKMWSADAFIQMGAYSIAFNEMTGVRPTQSVVVKMCDPEDERLKKYGGKAFSVYPRYALEEDEEMFLTRLRMYRYNQNFVSPKD